ncbi:MAG: FKBP-type peptidyl-prolyl cis-trans isomerase [Pirellulaceae bacterium]|nr:FKBP-type peptidyl-prolyl cis-trans isomerase [Pirellulaceae bacterium]
MNRVVTVAALWALFAGNVLADDLPAQKPDPAKIRDDASYSIGVEIGQSMKSNGLQVNLQQLVEGLTAGLNGTKPRLTDEQMAAAKRALFEMMANSSRQKGVDFLAANAKKPGVVTLESGLQYKVLKAGNGPSPKATDTVSTHYRGTLIDGTEFDSSYKRNMPTSFPVNRVIPGWTEALQKMKVGDRWQLFIPSELAYGARGAGDVIGPHETLIFDIELLEIVNE